MWLCPLIMLLHLHIDSFISLLYSSEYLSKIKMLSLLDISGPLYFTTLWMIKYLIIQGLNIIMMSLTSLTDSEPLIWGVFFRQGRQAVSISGIMCLEGLDVSRNWVVFCFHSPGYWSKPRWCIVILKILQINFSSVCHFESKKITQRRFVSPSNPQ